MINKYQAKYEVKIKHEEEGEIIVNIINEEGMSDDEIVLEAFILLQKENKDFDTEKVDSVSLELIQ